MLGMRLVTRASAMDSATPFEPAPAGGGISFVGQPNCPFSQGGGDTYTLFPRENRDSVAVATLGSWSNGVRQNIVGFASANRLFDCRSTQSITGLLKQNLPLGSGGWRQDPPISRERTCRRRHLWDYGQVRHDKIAGTNGQIPSHQEFKFQLGDLRFHVSLGALVVNGCCRPCRARFFGLLPATAV